MRFSRRLLFLALAIVLVFGMTSTGAAFPDFDADWYIDTSEYFGDVPYKAGLNAEVVQLGDENVADVEQIGENYIHIGQGIDERLGGVKGLSQDNHAFALQIGEQNEGEINQRGESNEALLWQIGDSTSNYAGIGQDGNYMFADVFQEGDDNFIRSSQFGGEGSESYILQFGNLNRSRTIQEGDNHSVEIHQGYYGEPPYDDPTVRETADFNYAFVDQRGESHSALVRQFDGEKNATLIEQAGSHRSAETYQGGDLNEALVNQK